MSFDQTVAAARAALEHDALQVAVGRVAQKRPPDVGRTGEGDHVDIHVQAKCFSREMLQTGDDVEDAGGNARLMGKFGKPQRREAGQFRGLITTELPVASAGPIFQESMARAKFQGDIGLAVMIVPLSA